MRTFLKDLRFMIRDAWQSRGSGRADGRVGHTDSLSRALRDASHVRAGRGGWSMSEAGTKVIGESHGRYAASFDDPDEIQK